MRPFGRINKLTEGRNEVAMDICKSLGDAIRKKRHVCGVSQDEVAARGGFSSRHFQELEKGVSMPSLAMVFKLARGLETEADTLIAPLWKQWKEQCNDES